MPGLLDHVAFLSQEVGPRPAGTEEEQQAALYITEQLQKEAGLSAVIEDFSSESNEEIPKALCSLIAIVFTVAALFLPILEIPALIAAAAAALIFVLESTGRPIISRMLASGVSQNVVAKYEPGYSSETGGSRRRKIIVVAHYDSGKVRSELNPPIVGILPVLQKVILGAIIAVPLFLLLRYLFFLHAEGLVLVVLNVIMAIILALVAIPLLFMLMHKFAPYNEAANCNASGVAVLLEVARRVGREQASASGSLFSNGGSGKIHGEEAARRAGLVPEGAQIVYEASQMKAPTIVPQTEQERLISAKAAIAALTGKPVPHKEQSSIADNLVRSRESFSGLRARTDHDSAEHYDQDETQEESAIIFSDALQTSPQGGAQNNTNFAGGVTVNEQFGDVEQFRQPPRPGFSSPSDQVLDVQTSQGSGVGAFSETASYGSADTDAQLGSPIAVPTDPLVPDWFKKAQENAKRPKGDKPTIKRSQYADALDAAVAESSTHFNRANSIVNAETEERLRKMRDGIMEVNAPQFARENLENGRAQATGGVVGTANTAGFVDATRKDATIEQPQAWSQQLMQTEAKPQTDGGHVNNSTIAMAPINVEELHNEVQPISLPDVLTNTGSLPSVIGASKQQRAPLAVAGESSQTAAKSLLNMLPSIELEETETGKAKDGKEPNEKEEGLRSSLTTLPSLSGAFKSGLEGSPQTTGEASPQRGAARSISAAGSFAAAGATGAFAPVGNELLENVHPDEIYVDDADDSAYENSLTETGAFAGPGYVDMPKSRAKKFFGRFRKNKNEEEISAQQWLDVDENFEAQKIGAARGNWKSFKEDSDSFDDSDMYRDSYEEIGEETQLKNRSQRESWEGGAFSRKHLGDNMDDFASAENNSLDFEPPVVQRLDELQQIQDFRSSGLDTEIWFVALGSELANNRGIRAFLAEHEQDLRGAIAINLGALGSGELSYLEKEGSGKAAVTSRMKRYVSKASQAVNIRVPSAAIKWKESATTIMAKRGFQAMSIVGMNGLKPAYFAQGDDILENIEEETLQINADFIMELVKSI